MTLMRYRNSLQKAFKSKPCTNTSSSATVTTSKRYKSTLFHATNNCEIYDRAHANATSFDESYNYTHKPFTVPKSVKSLLQPIRHIPIPPSSNDFKNYTKSQSHYEAQKRNIQLTPYALTGNVMQPPHHVILQDESAMDCLRESGRLARYFLDEACHLAQQQQQQQQGENENVNQYSTTAEIDSIVHQSMLQESAYPSPLNYAGFPRSICSSINEVICHGIPDGRRLQLGDVASFDVSCYYNGYHGDNCATVLVGDVISRTDNDGTTTTKLRDEFDSDKQEELFISGRRLIQASQEALNAAIQTCHPGSCLTDIGDAISAVSEAYGYNSVEKYRGHGIGRDFHTPPFVKHYRNDDRLELRPGMVFTIEPMLTEGGSVECVEWQSDGWTVVTLDGGRASQFEHMVAITENGYELLTIPSSNTDS